MNQILFTNDKNESKSRRNIRNIRNLKIIFFVSISLIIILFLYFTYNYTESNKKENMSLAMLNSYNIQRIYKSESDTITVQLNETLDFLIIGNIEIPSIGINYPILSDVNDELLKIAPCRFYGPYPNEIGNLCIAAHNYDDGRFFSNIKKLNIGETINVYDSNNVLTIYNVYDKYEINKDDTSCTSQNTNGKKEITLVTCNNLNGNRLIIKAKE